MYKRQSVHRWVGVGLRFSLDRKACFWFAFLDDDGALTALGFGTPPSWIDSVPAAEAWALLAAASRSMPGTTFKADCMDVVDTHRLGPAYATSANRLWARVWAMIYNVVDANARLEWIPAHTCEQDILDGTITAHDHAGNAAADGMAKRGGALHRLDANLVAELGAASERVAAIGRWLGEATARVGSSAIRDADALRCRRGSGWVDG